MTKLPDVGGRRARGRSAVFALVALAMVAVTPMVAPQAASAAPTGTVDLIAMGDSHSCAATDDEEIYCWGHNNGGQLGNGGTEESPTPVAVAMAGGPLQGKAITQLTAGAYHSCALTTEGKVSCWGDDAFQQLGDSASGDSSVPVAVSTAGALSGKTVTQISGRYLHTCALASDNTIACWGNNQRGELGNGTTTSSGVPVAVTRTGTPLEGKTITKIDVGTFYSCAITADGIIACWGYNTSGQLGNGTTTQSTLPVAVTITGTPLEGKTITQFEAGGDHACAVTTESLIACWGGASGAGQSSGKTTPTLVTTAATPLAGASIAEVVGGSGNTCVRTTANLLACWGVNWAGTLGNGTTTDSTKAVAVSVAGSPLAGKTITRLATGSGSVCALASDGTVGCWGENRYGEIGDGTAGYTSHPDTAPAGLLAGVSIAQVSAGGDAVCARSTAGAAYCWGNSPGGQLGNNSNVASAVPVAVVTAGTPIDGLPLTSISVGGDFTCALATGGTAACWGTNGYGELGRGSYTSSKVPVAVLKTGTPLEGKTIAQVVAGTSNACAITTDGVLACWGYNANGQVGNGTTTSQNKPTAIATAGTPLEGKTITQVAVGVSSTCALASDGVLACWGSNSLGQLGNDGTADSLVPTAVTIAGTPLEGKTIASIDGGDSGHYCALATDGTLACWGGNTYGEIGDGTTTHRKRPTAPVTAGTVLAGKTISGVSVGYIQVCVRTTDSMLACMGNNGLGGLGDGTTTDRWTPVAVATSGTPLAGKTITGLSLAYYTSCALASDSTISCWGDNQYGQHGNGTIGFALTPHLVVGLTTAPATVPGAPTIGSAVAGNAQVTVNWSAPASDGGSAVTGYVVTPYIGNVAQSSVASSGAGTSKVVTGLVNGTGYSFTVAAVNGVGTGAASAKSSVVTPHAAYYPFPNWPSFVSRQYLDMTTKPPSISDLNAWVAGLSNGSLIKGDLIESLRRGTDNTSNVDPTARLYRAFLGRAPDAGGLNFWIGRKRAGTWTVTRMADSFAASNEFKTKYGTLTNRQFVTRIYTDVLGRTADQAGVDYWTRKLDTKAKTRGGVMVGFSESSEYKRKQAENTDVAIAYIFLLGRVPTAGETTDWTTRQKAGTTQAELATELLDTSGYATHVAS